MADSGVAANTGEAVADTGKEVGTSVGGAGVVAELQAVNTTRSTITDVLNRNAEHMLFSPWCVRHTSTLISEVEFREDGDNSWVSGLLCGEGQLLLILWPNWSRVNEKICLNQDEHGLACAAHTLQAGDRHTACADVYHHLVTANDIATDVHIAL